ncbi:anti-sigma factor [Kocuria sp.]|uniref:anti-sigma factor n=1 Tax=Kocuria sp. TaxID=1871328 RepID=UPI002811013A|nr:anti-sigma factor [Kocuria sp.]
MAHLSEETLTLLALGEPIDPRGRDHLADCAECAAELASLQHVVRAGRAEPPAPAAPGPGVWAAIHAELGLSPAVAADPLTAGSSGTGPSADAPGGSEGDGASAVVDLDARRRRSRRGVPYPAAAAAAAAALLVGAGGMWALQRAEPEPAVLARAELEPLAGYSARGTAEIDQRPDGTRRLVVRTDPADVDGFKEVWLLAPDAQGMLSLGVMAGDEAVFVLPENVDVAQFPVVDVSNEPVDGDPTHSGDSIVRGTLDV